MKYTFKNFLLDTLYVWAGAVLYSIAIVLLLAPNGIAPGGVSGLSTIINHKLPALPIGLLIVLFNIPIAIVGIVGLGKHFMLKTVVSTVIVSLVTYLFEAFGTPFIYTGNTLLAAVFGGCALGAGMGLIFLRGFTTGGSDVLVRVVKKKHPQFTVGTITLALDALVIILAGIVYGNIENSFYALISIFVSTRMSDMLLNGADSARLVYIISNKHDEIAAYITREISRGITFLHGRGFYSGQEREVLLVAIRPHELFQVRSIIRHVDPNAFMIFSNATEVLGLGFKQDINN